VLDERVDVALVVGDVLQGATQRVGLEVVAVLPRLRPLRQGGRQPLLEPGDARLPERREDDLDQPVVLAVVVLRDRLEDLVGKPRRVGRGLGGNGAEITAGPAEHVADVAAAVVDPVQNRLSEVHEAPHQLERQVGAFPGHLVEDELALLVEVLHEGRALLPVDDGAGLA
jgi:hypothetical protein